MALLPFAYSNTLKKLVDIDEVTRGLRCNCICPSCSMRLKARQGDINEHHFSHSDKAQTTCSYSFWVSMRDMAKQILKETRYINLDLNKTNGLYKIPYNKNTSLVKILTAEKKNNGFDLELTTSIGMLNVYFLTPEESHKGYRFAKSYTIETLILEIDLNKMISTTRYTKKEQLQTLLVEKNNSKKLLAPKFVFPKKTHVEVFVSNTLYQKEQKKSIQTSVQQKVYDINSIAKELYLDPRSMTYKRKNAIAHMQLFYEGCKKIYTGPPEENVYTLLHKEDVYEFISFDGKYYAIVDVDGIYVLYTFDDEEFSKIHSSRNKTYLADYLQKLYEEAGVLF
ncbi:MAG: hypothetical protein PHX13_00930 [Thiovulaceae bacterium]|nr:hypothetical protein [Sulfurimonadaceae bacterium]